MMTEWLTSSQEENLLRELPFNSFSASDMQNLEFIESKSPQNFTEMNGNNDENESKFINNQVVVYNMNYPGNLELQNIHVPMGKEEFPGELNFEVILNERDNSKNCVFSRKLSKIYLKMESTLPVRFRWTPAISGLEVRAVVVYKLDQHRNEAVHRCPNHLSADKSLPEEIRQHVIRSTNITSRYEEFHGHYSVSTTLGIPQPGEDTVVVDYKLYCKNSCGAGMNRRPTEIIFTLEIPQTNQVLGRRSLGLRVCSCPERDRCKEEKEENKDVVGAGKKRKPSPPLMSPPPGKKFAITPVSKVFHVQLAIPDEEVYNSILKYAFDACSGAAIRNSNYELFKPCMDDILKKMH